MNPHGIPTLNGLLKKIKFLMLLQMLEFSPECPFHARHVGKVQAFLFSYTKPCPMLKEIIAFQLCQCTDSVDWEQLAKQLHLCSIYILQLPLQGFSLQTKYLLDENLQFLMEMLPMETILLVQTETEIRYPSLHNKACGPAAHGVGWSVVLQFMKQSLLVFQWSLYSYTANNEFSLPCK